MRRASLLLLTLASAAGCHRAAANTAPAKAAVAAAPVVQIRSHLRSDDERKPNQPVAVVVDGKSATWTAEQLDATPVLELVNKNGESREGWALRDLAAKFVGPKARVTAVVGSGGQKLAIDAKDWQDAKKILIMKVSHKGDYKLHWAMADGSADDAILKGVKEIDIQN
jgi:hypothetical protein